MQKKKIKMEVSFASSSRLNYEKLVFKKMLRFHFISKRYSYSEANNKINIWFNIENVEKKRHNNFSCVT